jgi:hypothetical protein
MSSALALKVDILAGVFLGIEASSALTVTIFCSSDKTFKLRMA